MSENLFAQGIAAEAHYEVPTVRAYRGNPFIEALPRLLGREEVKAEMSFFPEYDERDRLAPAIDREHMASLLSTVRCPVGVHAELHSRISRLLRNGYLARNPMQPFFQANIDAREASLVTSGKGRVSVVSAYALKAQAMPSATGLTFLGLSGLGKSVAIDMCLQLLPQLLLHSEYRGQRLSRTQLVWLRLDAPPDASILSLCDRFFAAIDSIHEAAGIETGYRREYVTSSASIHRLVTSMSRVAAQHGLGILVLDELQDLDPRGSRAMLSFLVQLVNTVGIPVVLVGGIDALPHLTAQFRQARRGASEGDMILSRGEPGRLFREFCGKIWRFQYTATETPLSDAILDALYEESRGITQYVVNAIKLAQIRAIAVRATDGENAANEVITPAIIRSIRDSLAVAQPALTALRRNDFEAINKRDDLSVPVGIPTIPFLRGDDTGRAPAPASPNPAVEESAASSESCAPVAPPVDGDSAGVRRVRIPKRRGANAQNNSTHSANATAAVPTAVAAVPLGPPLHTAYRAALEAGKTAREMLKEEQVVDDPLWKRLLEDA